MTEAYLNMTLSMGICCPNCDQWRTLKEDNEEDIKLLEEIQDTLQNYDSNYEYQCPNCGNIFFIDEICKSN